MNSGNIISLGISVIITSSCSFNGVFHKPFRTVAFNESVQQYNGNNTLYVDYNKAEEEIILKDSASNRLNKDFRIHNKNFQSSNGNILNGWLLTPDSNQPIGTILHLHGSAGNLLTHYQSIIPLVHYGYQIFMFDYSGYGSSKGKPTHKVVLEDVYSALDYLSKNENLRGSKIFIYGQSYGGYLAAILGSNSQMSIDGIVIEGAFTSLREEAKHKASVFGNFVKKGIQADVQIRKNYKPLLVIHSEEDDMVPVEFGREIFLNANDPKEFYEIDGPHNGGLSLYPEEIADRIYQLMLTE